MQRVICVSHSAALDGGASFVYDEMLETLREFTDSELVAVLPREGTLAERARLRNIPVEIVAQPPWAYFPGTRRPLRLAPSILKATFRSLATIRRHGPDVVIVNTMTIPAAAIAGRLSHCRVVWYVHEFGKRDHDLGFLLGYERTVRLIGRLASAVVCNSHAVATEMKRVGIPAGKVTVSYYAMRTPISRPTHRTPFDRPLVAIVSGRVAESKGQLMAVRAVAAAAKRGADIQLRLMGPVSEQSYAERVRRTADELGISDRVEWLGNQDDPFAEYRRAHVLLMCSRDEAFGRVTVEAMRCGLPVIGFDSGGTSELVDETIGRLVPPGDHEAMGQHLFDLWNNDEKRVALGYAAVRAGESGFSAPKWASELIGAFVGLPAGANPP